MATVPGLRPEQLTALTKIVMGFMGELGSKKREEFFSKTYGDGYVKYAHDGRYALTVSVTRPDTAYDFKVDVTIGGLGAILRFNLKGVESCCAMSFLYGFLVAERMPSEMLKAIMDFVLKALAFHRYALTSNRLIINMVEYRFDSEKRDPLEDVQPVDNPAITYKPLWDYFHGNAAKVNTMLMRNANTGKIIHHMEVLFTPEFLHS